MAARLETFVLERCGQPVSLADLTPYLHEEVFCNAKPEHSDAPGVPGSALTLPLSRAQIGPVVVFYVNATDTRLQRPFAGLRLDEALEIANALDAAAGVAIQSSKAEALIIEKQNLRGVPHRGVGPGEAGAGA